MPQVLLFNKPYGVLTQFTDHDGGRPTLARYVDVPGVYPAGRLDRDSEGLLVLTDDGRLQHQLSHPRFGKGKGYWVQVDGQIDDDAIGRLRRGVDLKDGRTRPCEARAIPAPSVWPREPAIRVRKHIPTSWIALTITEGRNRQVRRMTAAVGFPTLRLIRHRLGPYSLDDLPLGTWRRVEPPRARGRRR